MNCYQLYRGLRLTQQYFVDSQVKIETDRINWCKDNRTKLKRESYQGLVDYLHTRAGNENKEIGKITIFSSNFIGSPRIMVQKDQD